MDICYKDISDVKVQDFLNGFIKDLAVIFLSNAKLILLKDLCREKDRVFSPKEEVKSNQSGQIL